MIARKYRERYLDQAGIFKYDEQRERQNAIAYQEEQKLKRTEAKKRKRANLKAWRQRNQKK